MEPYLLIFLNSLKSSIIISMYSENAWFAAIEFGHYNVVLTTIAAIIGSSLGTLFNFGIGYYFAGKRGNWFAFKESWYTSMTAYNRYTMWLLLVPFSAVPLIGTFFSLYIVVAGFLRIPFAKAAGLIVIGRIAYYLLCLMGASGGI